MLKVIQPSTFNGLLNCNVTHAGCVNVSAARATRSNGNAERDDHHELALLYVAVDLDENFTPEANTPQITMQHTQYAESVVAGRDRLLAGRLRQAHRFTHHN